MYILRALVLLFLAQAVLAEQPTPILPDAKLTPGDTFDVTAEDVCVPGYAKKVRAVPAWLKRQAYAEYGITQYKTGDYKVDQLTIPVCRLATAFSNRPVNTTMQTGEKSTCRRRVVCYLVSTTPHQHNRCRPHDGHGRFR